MSAHKVLPSANRDSEGSPVGNPGSPTFSGLGRLAGLRFRTFALRLLATRCLVSKEHPVHAGLLGKRGFFRAQPVIKPAVALGSLLLGAATAFGALSATFNSPYEVGATASSYTASGTLTVALNFSPTPGQQLLLVNNTGTGAISGTFTGLAEGATRTATYGGNTFTFRISYVGGTGNDITLTRVAGSGQVTSSNTYLWSHLAGSTGGLGSADGMSLDATFNTPSGVAIDSSGNIYVADTENHTIRKVNSSGVVTTLAGTARMIGGADSVGSAARFNKPLGIAVDNSGNVYVAGGWSRTIRKVTPAGEVTTLAGSYNVMGSTDGTGAAARFIYPSAVAVDSSGNVYVADQTRLRKVSQNGVVTTLAGSGSSGSTDGIGSAAMFSELYGVTVDSSGNVYVTDRNAHTVRKVTSAGVVTTLAGTAYSSGSSNGTGSSARFYNPTGITVDSTGNLYVADSYYNKIRKVTPVGVVTTLAGSSSGSTDGTGSAAKFLSPQGMSVDGAGNVYVADSLNHTIRKVTSAGVVTTQVGSAAVFETVDGTGRAARFNGTKDVEVDSTGNIYVSSYGDPSLRKITNSGVVTTLLGGGSLTFGGLSSDASGNLYAISGQSIKKVTSGGVVTILAGTEYVSGSADGTGDAARFSAPSDVAVDSAGNVYVADRSNHTIRKVTPAGVVTTLAGAALTSGSADGTGTAARFNGPSGISVDSTGNVYVADSGNYTIRKVTPLGVVTTLAGKAGSSGNVDGTGSAARFYSLEGLEVDSTGCVYVASPANHLIRKLNPEGLVTTIGGKAGSPGCSVGYGENARFNYPRGVSVNNSGQVYVVDLNNPRVVQGVEAGFQPILTLGSVTGLGGGGATLNGTVNPNGFVTTAAFEYGTTLSYGSSASVTLSSSNGTLPQNVSAVLTGLNPGTTYYYRLTATNVDGAATSTGGTFTATLSNNADLSSLTSSKGTLSPAFDSATISYAAIVANSNASITVTPTSSDANAILAVRINAGTYATVSSSSPSASLPLNVGSNTINVRVTAQDGVTQKIYTVTVTRLASALPQLLAATHQAPAGQSFSYQIVSTSEDPVTFSATGLPAGLTLNASTGIISGTVAVAGTYSVTTTVSNGSEQSSATLTLVVSTSALPFLNEPGVIRACIGQGLNHDFGAANSPAAAGVLGLPPGLFQYDRNDDGVNDAIGGSPIAAGTFRVAFWAENSLGRTERSAIIHVTKPAVATSSQMLEGLDGRALVKDRFGNTYLGAHFYNSAVTVGGTTYTLPSAGQGTLIVKVSPTGQVLWSYQLSVDGFCDLSKIAVDSAGNVIACGQLYGGISMFEGTAVSGEQLFVLKLSTGGTRTWARVQGVGGGNVSCGALAIDGSDNIWFGGWFIGSLGFSNGTTLTSSSLEGANNGYVAGYSATGTLVSPRMFGSTSVCQIYSIAADPQGPGIFVAGNFSGNVIVPGSGANPSITLTHPSGNAAQPTFVACIGGATAGAHWAKQLPDGDIWSERNCLTADASGGLYLAGRYANPPPSDPLPENSIALPGIRNGGAFLAKLSASTTFGLKWIKDLPGSGLPAIAFDGSHSLYLENNDYGGSFDKIAYNGNSGRYLAKFNQDGEAIWVRDSMNASNNNYPLLAFDSGGNLSLSALSDGTSPLSTGDHSASGAGTGLFLLGNPPAASAGSLPAISSSLNQTWVASRNSNREYTYQITGTNSPTSYWASDLPMGIQFDESTGLITARPSEPGTYTSTIWAMNAAGYGSATLTVTVTPDPDPEITSPATATATVGQPFSYQIAATNSPTSFSAYGPGVAGGLPDGLSFNATSGLIQGTPILAGQTFFVVRASNANGDGSLFVTLTVAGNPAIVPPTVQAGSITATVGQPLSYQIQATGALRYGATSAGSSASGLTCDRSTGIISWTPASAGTYTITLQGINGGGVTSALLQITVSPANGGGGAIGSWRQQYFGSDQNSGNSADLATPDGDGIPNLVKYALLMTPGQNGSSRLPQAEMTGATGNRRLALSFQRDPSRNDVTIVVEAQSALGGAWTEIARSTNGADFTGAASVSETAGDNGARRVSVGDVVTNASRRFMRVRVLR